MSDIIYYNRLTGREEVERVYGQRGIKLLYADRGVARFFARIFLPVVARYAWVSRLYGWFQKTGFSRRKIKPFIQAFNVDSKEFLKPVESFSSFNDFFIRQLKKEVRPLAMGPDQIILPADARYLVFPHVKGADGFLVKDQKFHLDELLGNALLAKRFEGGSMVMARLCPTDYHRFHFPCDGVPGNPHLINGYLFSVNPLAIRQNIHIFSQNKRMITSVQTERFGELLYLEIGATSVGSIHQTFVPQQPCHKGDEKGYFSFGGSSLILLFEPNRILFDQDLIEMSALKREVRGLLGQSLGRAT